MPSEESRYPADWLRIAEKDWGRAQRFVNEDDPELTGFCLQAVEKFLKAYLLAKGWRLKRTHDLEVLLNATLEYDPALESFRAVCQKITNFYLVERYPLATGLGLTEEDVRDALREVEGLIHKLRAEA
ncbi:MAG: HEPN domain-containing protein [Deinococcota bacterium]|nr:HEPN domain-containing protein [Deinococcota bacterium]